MTLAQEDLNLIKTHEPDLPLCGGLGAMPLS